MTDLFQDDDQSQIAAYIPGETNKYKSLEELAKGAYEKDRHISQVERENRELRATNLTLRDDNMTKAKLEEYIDQITKSASASARPASETGNNPKPTDVQPFDPKQLEPMFDKRIKEYEASKTKEQNVKAVTDVLRERYGHSFPEVLQKQTEELGLTKEAVNYLAETAPRAFFKTLGLDQAPQTDTFSPPKRSVHFSPKVEPERTWSYYQDLQTKDPSTFRSPKIQEQMMKDYQRLGPKFEDGNFLAYGQQSAFT